MINAELGHVTTVEEFNTSIREQQEKAHGADYCAIHDAIRKYMAECNSYMELGTHQGGTASVALMCKPKTVCLVDIDTSRYNKFLAPIATKYCAENNINLDVRNVSSHSLASVNTTDMLVIDSYHHPMHMQKELELHGHGVRKYILAHDTSVINGKQNDSLFRCMKDWGEKNGWKVIERGKTNVGYTVLGKK